MPDSLTPACLPQDATAAALLEARYGAPEIAAPALWNDTLSLLLGHRSVRAFLPDPVPADTLPTLVAAAQSAPTSSNLQTWSVVAVQDTARKARLSVMAGSQGHIDACPLFLVWLADLARTQQLAADRGVDVEGPQYLEMMLVAAIDATLAAQNAVVALESMGLGSVYIGGIRNRPEAVAAELGLPPQVFAVFGLCVGIPDPSVHTDIKPRLPQSAVLHTEQYDATPAAGRGERLRGADERVPGIAEPAAGGLGAPRGGPGSQRRFAERTGPARGGSGDAGVPAAVAPRAGDAIATAAYRACFSHRRG